MHLEIDMCQKKIFFGWSHPHNWITTSLFIQVFFRMFWTFFYENISIPKTWTRKLGKRRKIKTFTKKFFNLFFAEVFGEMDLHSHYRNINSELKSEKNSVLGLKNNVGNFFLIWEYFYPHNSLLILNVNIMTIFSQLLCRMLLL